MLPQGRAIQPVLRALISAIKQAASPIGLGHGLIILYTYFTNFLPHKPAY